MAVVSLKNGGDEEIPGGSSRDTKNNKVRISVYNLIYLSPKFALSPPDGQCERFFSLPKIRNRKLEVSWIESSERRPTHPPLPVQ